MIELGRVKTTIAVGFWANDRLSPGDVRNARAVIDDVTAGLGITQPGAPAH